MESLITRRVDKLANMTDLNQLIKSGMAKPAVLARTIDRMFATKAHRHANPITADLVNTGAVEEISETTYEYKAYGDPVRNLTIAENAMPASSTVIGNEGRSFKIKFVNRFVKTGDVVIPNGANKKFQARIVTDGELHGNGYVYRAELVTDDRTVGIPKRYFASNQQWGKMFSLYGEAAKQGGSTRMQTYMNLRNSLTKHRKEWKITDYASQATMQIALKDHSGKFHKTWVSLAEFNFIEEFKREEALIDIYGIKSDKMDTTGYPITTGAGVHQQIAADGHIHYYNTLSSQLLEDFMMGIYYSRTSPSSSKRKLKGYTGEYGMIQFSNAMNEWTQRRGITLNVEHVTSKVNSILHTNALEVGYQIVRYNLSNGLVFELEWMPLYDDVTLNREIDPITGYPYESQRITFLDFEGEDGKSNLIKMRKKNSTVYTYLDGLTSSTGVSERPTHAGEYTELHASMHTNVQIMDATKCGELILKRN